jgi:hypothetical protein
MDLMIKEKDDCVTLFFTYMPVGVIAEPICKNLFKKAMDEIKADHFITEGFQDGDIAVVAQSSQLYDDDDESYNIILVFQKKIKYKNPKLFGVIITTIDSKMINVEKQLSFIRTITNMNNPSVN